MFKYTKHSLKKLEILFEEIGYVVRYEKGNFQSGYCIVRDKQIAIINKFFDTEARINCLLDILSNISFDDQVLSEKSKKLFKQVQAAAINDTETTDVSS